MCAIPVLDWGGGQVTDGAFLVWGCCQLSFSGAVAHLLIHSTTDGQTGNHFLHKNGLQYPGCQEVWRKMFCSFKVQKPAAEALHGMEINTITS